MERNHTMLQFFEWHIAADGDHWKRLRDAAKELKEKGIDGVWIPPVTKGESDADVGYGVYDLYDLGEFDQKGTIRTKYGTKEELHEAIQACQEQGIQVYVDIVMNHKAGADEKETFEVIEVDAENRLDEISDPFEIEGWTKFTFPGREGKYSDFEWNFHHFNGTDYDAREERTGFFKIVGENKDWNDEVDEEFGNYDYLMFANIDYNHPEVRDEMISWGKWMIDTLQHNGYRLDAIKHISSSFINDFIKSMMAHRDGNFYIVGEYWNTDLEACGNFLEETEYQLDLFDVQLHYKLHEVSEKGRDADLSALFNGTLVKEYPMNAVTFVDNHDSQPGESLESWIQDWFKQSAYALILLRKDGYPCVFYGDYFGIDGEEPIEDKREAIDPLIYARYHKAYGDQDDYFDHPATIGWVRHGVEEIKGSGCAVVVTVGDEGEKRMFVGQHRAGEQWRDYTNSREEHMTIDEEGYGTFPVNAGSVSVWALPEE
ncbi:alpha-amylase [Jeotgalibacillus sp. R-1-5s-1]|uniref:alpha-amylase n=1 Tax=Jeotgalibacillus sp. R-1-5s-1 TaxID=2555897 RepID=UPI0010692E28|nr:alpha-amylase [Jeotgalibacillus sp. R-1-5s-1]TFE00003.1 alpha-amylase [Jeotgalibacillus sp. R-1-5s-1]